MSGARQPRPGRVTGDGGGGGKGDAPRDVDGDEQGAPVLQEARI